MSFVQKHSEIVGRIEKVSDGKMYVKVFGFSLVLFAVFFVYMYLDKGSLTVYDLNSLFAIVATYLIGFSLALSGLCYFWNFVDSKIVYRKFLGIVGFGYAVAHAIASLTNYFLLSNSPKPNFDVYHVWVINGIEISNLYSFFAAIIGLCIFILMAAISNRYAVLELGGVRWRQLLRTGYIAIVLVAVHFGIKRADQWLGWFQGKEGTFPHISLHVFIFVVLVLLLRLALAISLLIKKRKAVKPADVKITTVNSPITQPAIPEQPEVKEEPKYPVVSNQPKVSLVNKPVKEVKEESKEPESK